MTRLLDLCSLIRSKNAGPVLAHLRLLARDTDSYRTLRDSGALNKELFATLYGADPRRFSSCTTTAPKRSSLLPPPRAPRRPRRLRQLRADSSTRHWSTSRFPLSERPALKGLGQRTAAGTCRLRRTITAGRRRIWTRAALTARCSRERASRRRNAGLGLRHEPGPCEGQDAETEEERAEYQRRFDDYTQTLLCDFHADPDRFDRGRRAPPRRSRGLAEAGLTRVRAAGARTTRRLASSFMRS